MRRILLTCVAGLVVLCCGCKPSAPAVDMAPVGTIRDVMASIVKPSADYLWGSVSLIITAKGAERKEPRTDEDWEEVHNHAVALVEATNLLLMPNRHVARDGQKADNPDVERDPKDIEAMMKADRATLLNRLAGLRAAALKMLAAADARDVKAIDEDGEVLDMACENCHMTYWYLPDKK